MEWLKARFSKLTDRQKHHVIGSGKFLAVILILVIGYQVDALRPQYPLNPECLYEAR